MAIKKNVWRDLLLKYDETVSLVYIVCLCYLSYCIICVFECGVFTITEIRYIVQ